MRELNSLLVRKSKVGSLGALDYLIERANKKQKKSSKNYKPNTVEIVFISDQNYILPTMVAIYSLKITKQKTSQYSITILADNISAASQEKIKCLQEPGLAIFFLHPKNIIKELHLPIIENHILSATRSALYKFYLGEIFHDKEKILYLDGDLIVKKDLTELFETDLSKYTIAACPDSGQIYFKHAIVRRVKKYFNTGVMLINCNLMRRKNYSEKLINARLELKESKLMDQDAFNIIFDDEYAQLPIKYNLLYTNLKRAKRKYTISDINQLYKRKYNSLAEIKKAATVIHYASKEKPWNSDQKKGGDWYTTQNTMAAYIRTTDIRRIDITVIIPIFNSESYLKECIESILQQDNVSIEIICVLDGSSDSSWKIAEKYAQIDKRISTLYQYNMGQSAARNLGLKYARGKYIYFMDSDDILRQDALKVCLSEMENNNLDIVYFDANSIYENEKLKSEFHHYETYYQQKGEYPYVMDGQEAFCKLVGNLDYRPAPVLQMLKHSFIKDNNIYFEEGIIHEDNIFTIKSLLLSKRVRKIKNVLYTRRVRRDSTMTMKDYRRSYFGYLMSFIKILEFIQSIELSNLATPGIVKQLNGMLRLAEINIEKLKNLEGTFDPNDIINEQIVCRLKRSR